MCAPSTWRFGMPRSYIERGFTENGKPPVPFSGTSRALQRPHRGAPGTRSGEDPTSALRRPGQTGEPDVGNLHLRFDEGRAGPATGVAFSPTLPLGPSVKDATEGARLGSSSAMSSGRQA